jgi:hypothetical protein
MPKLVWTAILLFMLPILAGMTHTHHHTWLLFIYLFIYFLHGLALNLNLPAV